MQLNEHMAVMRTLKFTEIATKSLETNTCGKIPD